MNPADADQVQHTLDTQAETLQRHEALLTSVTGGLQDFAATQDRNMADIRQQMQQLFTTRASGAEPRLPPPERYSGEPGTCRPFLTQCSLLFELQPSAYPSERARVAFIISQLTGRARDWGTAEWERQSLVCSSVKLFSDGLKRVFDHVTPGREAARGLLHLTQEGRSVADYSIEFRTIAAESKWNSDALFDAFYHGLSKPLRTSWRLENLPWIWTPSSPVRFGWMGASGNGRRRGLRLPLPVVPLASPLQITAPSCPPLPTPRLALRSPCSWGGPTSPGLNASAACGRTDVCTAGRLAILLFLAQ